MLPVCLLLACAILGTHGLPSRFESDELDPQIIGGKIIDIEKTPWQVSVERYKSHRCGGSIIAKRWTLTSARCVDSFIATVTDFGVRYGTASLGKGGTVLQVTWVGYHDKFDKDTYQYDVGLVQMAEDVVYSSTAQAIPLTPVGSLPRGTDLLTVSGWGEDSIYSYDYSYPDSLSAVSLPYIPRSTCQISYSTKGKIIDATMICAGVTGKDACKGDEGGALVNAYGLQVGIASWSLGCDEPGFPSVYVNLGNAGVREFIQNKAGIV